MPAVYTDAQLQALKNALASGMLTVKFADREVTYRSVDELRKAIATVEGELNGALSPTLQPGRQIRIFTGKGF